MTDDQGDRAGDPGDDTQLPGIDPSLFADPDGGSDPDPADDTAPAGSLDDFAEEFDATALEEGSSEKKTDADGKPVDAPAPDALDDFIAKNFKGDKNAFLHSQYASREEGKRLAEENKRLARELEEARTSAPPRDTAAEIKAALESNREVQTLNREIKAIENEDTQLASRQVEIVDSARRLTSEIEQLNAKLQHEDDPKLISQLTSARTEKKVELQVLNSEWNSNKAELKSNRAEKRTLQSDLRRTERDVKEEMAEKESREETQRSYIQRQHRAFNSAFAHFIEPYGVKPQTAKFNLLHTTVRTTVADYLDRIDSPDLDPQELAAVIGRVTAATAQELGLKKAAPAGNGKGPAPRRVVAPGAPQRQPAPARDPGSRTPASSPGSKSKDELLSDPDYIRKRATAVFNAAKQRAGGGRG